MATTLTVPGSCGAWAEAGRACSGFLLDADGFRVVIDLGYGTASRLSHALGSTSGDGLDAVVITHRHPDLMVDLHALFRARWFASRNSPPLPVYAAVGVRERLVSMDEPDDGADVDRIFAFNPLPGNYTVGPLTLSALDLPDHVPKSGVRIAFRDLTIAYTGDAGPSEALAELAAGGRPPAGRGERPPPATRGPALTDFGVSPEWADAGRFAAGAGVGSLVLTHFWPGNDREATRAAAAAHFAGPIALTEEGMVVSLG